MNKPRLTEQVVMATKSESVRRLNPHLFGPSGPDVTAASMLKEIDRQPKRIRQDSKPLLNKLEEQFLAVLELELPEHTTIWKQALRWRLGNGIWYKPDFAANLTHDHHGFTCWEVKGPHAFRGGFENLKVAAGLYPEVAWWLVWKESGRWERQMVRP